jgi:ribosomal-protein-alanine N-acetyltransferase
MSAVRFDAGDAYARHLSSMQVPDLDEVVAIEKLAYTHPWSHGNFIDSLASGYPSRVLRDAQGRMTGYFIAMKGVDEMHLLNLAVAPGDEGRGHARFMLDALCLMSRGMGADLLWLEVRVSNARARRLYGRYGFRHVGERRGYYPAFGGQREDAVVMSLSLAASGEAAKVPYVVD